MVEIARRVWNAVKKDLPKTLLGIAISGLGFLLALGINHWSEQQKESAIEVLKNVRPSVIEGGMSIDPEEAGAGVQSAIALGVAKAYADIVRNPVVTKLDRPES